MWLKKRQIIEKMKVLELMVKLRRKYYVGITKGMTWSRLFEAIK